MILIWVPSFIAGLVIGAQKGHPALGLFLGLILGPIGVIILLFIPNDKGKAEAITLASGDLQKCPYCAEFVKSEALICRFCGKELQYHRTSAYNGAPLGSVIRNGSLSDLSNGDLSYSSQIIPDAGWTCQKCGIKNSIDKTICDSCGFTIL